MKAPVDWHLGAEFLHLFMELLCGFRGSSCGPDRWNHSPATDASSASEMYMPLLCIGHGYWWAKIRKQWLKADSVCGKDQVTIDFVGTSSSNTNRAIEYPKGNRKRDTQIHIFTFSAPRHVFLFLSSFLLALQMGLWETPYVYWFIVLCCGQTFPGLQRNLAWLRNSKVKPLLPFAVSHQQPPFL